MELMIKADAVAQLLGLTNREAFLSRRSDLEECHGFPKPMPQSNRPYLWRRAAVMAWIKANGAYDPDATEITVGHGMSLNVVMLDAARTA